MNNITDYRFAIYERMASQKLNKILSEINSHNHGSSGGVAIDVDNAIADKSIPGSKLEDGAVDTLQLADGAVTTIKIADGSVTSDKLSGSGSASPPGSITEWGGAIASPPTGWLVCDGSTFSAAAYPDLAAVLGDIWGSHAADNYYLPDATNRFAYGASEGTAVGNASVGSVGIGAPLGGNDDNVNQLQSGSAGGTGGGSLTGTTDAMAPYFAVAYIIKT